MNRRGLRSRAILAGWIFQHAGATELLLFALGGERDRCGWVVRHGDLG